MSVLLEVDDAPAYLDDLGLQERILDVPCRCEERETPHKHFVPSGQFKALRTLPSSNDRECQRCIP